jgi:hypothetical protein
MARLLGLDSALKQSIFAGYVLLWVASHVLVYASRRGGAPTYNATSVVLITEVVKLGLALGLYCTYDVDVARGSRMGAAWRQLVAHVTTAPDLPFRYAAPALLYCIYNNLVYTNLAAFDPGTYNVLMQLRIVFTGLLYQVTRHAPALLASESGTLVLLLAHMPTCSHAPSAGHLLAPPEQESVARNRVYRRRLRGQGVGEDRLRSKCGGCDLPQLHAPACKRSWRCSLELVTQPHPT